MQFYSFRPFLYLLLAVLLGSAVYYCSQVFIIGAAYKAKLLCSNIFLAKRDPEQILQDDLNGLERFLDVAIDYQKKSVSSWLPFIPPQQAVYAEGLGCVLLAGMDIDEFRKRAATWTAPAVSPPAIVAQPLALTPASAAGFDMQLLDEALRRGFAESDPDFQYRTRAILVLHDGRLIAERYAPGFTQDTLILGWSMTKSVINALVGILVKQGKLDLYKPVPIPEWSGPEDPRGNITLDQLLRMSSGLEFDETAGPVISDVTNMLLRQQDIAAFAIAKPLQHPPDSVWNYSSGTANIVSYIVRQASGGTPGQALAFVKKELFKPLGMHRSVIETDASGNLIGSSFMYATAREWLSFGQLYLQDGFWNGLRLLPPGWVNYSAMPTAAAQGRYGAHFWSNGGPGSATDQRPLPALPADLYYASGYKGQRLVIIPSSKLVILRLGWSDDFSIRALETLVTNILSAQKKPK